MGERCFYYSVCAISVCFVLGYSYIPALNLFHAYITPLFMYLLVGVAFYTTIHDRLSETISCPRLVWTLLLWNVIILIRGYADASDYWDYKALIMSRTPALLFPIIVFWGGKLNPLQKIYSFLLRVNIPLSLIVLKKVFFPLATIQFCFLIPWIGIMKRKWYLYLFIFFLIIGFDITSRAVALRVLFGFLLFLVIRYANNISQSVYKFLFVIMTVVPMVLVVLGYTGTFNVFEVGDNMEQNKRNEEMAADTRSFLYYKVHDKLQKENKEFIGLGGTSEYWEGYNKKFRYGGLNNKGIADKGRDHTESGLLNMYLYGGWIGAILFSLLFIVAAHKAMFQSNSHLCKLLGLFVLFRWVISFVDEPEAWITSNILLFYTIGLCMSYNFREKTDEEIWEWIKGF